MATTAEQREHLARAVRAASERNAGAFLREVAASFLADGVIDRLARQWSREDRAVLHDAVADALDALYARVADGGLVRDPAGFVWGTAEKILKKRWRDRPREEPLSDLEPDPRAAFDEDALPERDRDLLRAEALRVARSFLPKLGMDVVPRVMSFIFDCIEAGDIYVTNETIANALGLTTATVRRSKNRGFDRLAELGRKAGIKFDDRLVTAAEDARLESLDVEKKED